MAETQTAPASAPTSASPAPVGTPPAVTPAAAATDTGKQSSEPNAPAAPGDPVKRDEVRRAEALARAKREGAKVHQERERFNQERQAHEQALRKAQEFDRLEKLKADDPLKYLEAQGLKFNDLSKRYIEQSTGQGKSPADLVKEEVDRRLREEAAARDAAQQKREAEEAQRRLSQTYEGAKTQMTEMIQKDPDRFELAGFDAPAAVDRAFVLMERFFKETKQVLDFGKALDAVEAEAEKKEISRLGSKKVKAALAKQREAEAEAARKVSLVNPLSSTKSSGRATPRAVETEKQPSPTPTARRRRPLDYRAMADQLLNEHKAKTDN